MSSLVMPTSNSYKEFFTSDTHFGHRNVLTYDNRPFDNVWQMQTALIDNWNSVVRQNDTVYHLGDVAFGSPAWTENIVDKLHGYKVLIRGNHDGTMSRAKRLGFNAVYDDMLMIRGDKHIYLKHSPWAAAGHIGEYSTDKVQKSLVGIDADIILHGHLHTKGWKVRQEGHRKLINVGCMLWGYIPRTLEELLSE